LVVSQNRELPYSINGVAASYRKEGLPASEKISLKNNIFSINKKS
jgi:hypothetical protein